MVVTVEREALERLIRYNQRSTIIALAIGLEGAARRSTASRDEILMRMKFFSP